METQQLLADVKFTHDWYYSLLERLQGEGYTFRTFSDRPNEGDVFLRHDVDLTLDAALTMARIESRLDVQSTYCILLSSPLYNPLDGENTTILREILDLGHDIGLHFSTHNYWQDTEPERHDIEYQVQKERAILDKIVPEASSVVSFHRPPSWVLNRRFSSFENTYSPAFFTDVEYIADSNQRWRESPPQLDAFPNPIQILVHPGLWGDQDEQFEHCVEYCVINSCRYANRRAREEFIEPNRTQ